MRIVLSRKGFDASAGGCASPVLPDGTMIGLPILGTGSSVSYSMVTTPAGSMGRLAEDLTGKPTFGRFGAHLDPDLRWDALDRIKGWRPTLGQTGASRTHLESRGVGPGDVFVFFGWFRGAEERDGRWAFRRGSRDEHLAFGWLQVEEIVELGGKPDSGEILSKRPWLDGHPHLTGERDANNALYVASERLVLGGEDTGLPGAGAFGKRTDSLALTAPEACARSFWKVPGWLGPGGAGLSYHGDADRWSKAADGTGRLRVVAKGQEFVADTGDSAEAAAWLENLVREGMGFTPTAGVGKPGMRRR